MSAALIAACLGTLTALGAMERAALARARRRVPIRIHVNGTRGKSTVTRLVWAALRAANVPTVGKVTGTRPRLLLPDGTEGEIRRRGPANVAEQMWLLRQAASMGAEAVVVECMALRPELQWVSEQSMLRATVAVVTNVRTDHVEVMGRSHEAIATALANTVPRGGTLVLGDPAIATWFTARARALGTRVVVAETQGEAPGIAAENHATALAVTRELGIVDQLARSAFDTATPDPGAAAELLVQGTAGPIRILDLTAANDPESLSLLLAERDTADPRRRHTTIVYNHRADRGPRLATFAASRFGGTDAAEILVTGDRPALELWLGLRRHGLEPRFVRLDRLTTALRDECRGDTRVVLCGNARGIDRELLTGGR